MAKIQKSGIALLVFEILLVLFLVSLSNTTFMQKTISGQRFEYLQTMNSNFLPKVFTDFARRNHIKYKLYKTPNYIEELFKLNNEYLPIYKSGKKYTIIVFPSSKNKSLNLEIFYNELTTLLKLHHESFNYLSFDYDNDIKYNIKPYNYAYKDLKSMCKVFCLVDPVRNTIFSFSDNRNIETEALSILLQEYSLLSK